jgi:hypothetical protein
MLKFNFYLWLEFKPKQKDCDQILTCGGHCVRTMNERAKNLQPIQILNVEHNYKTKQHTWLGFSWGFNPNPIFDSPQRSKRKVCTKQATLVWRLGCVLTLLEFHHWKSPSFILFTLIMWIICVGRVVFIVCGWFSRTLNYQPLNWVLKLT